MVTSSSPLRATYSRQSLASINVDVLPIRSTIKKIKQWRNYRIKRKGKTKKSLTKDKFDISKFDSKQKEKKF